MFLGNLNRRKRSPNNPIEVVQDIKQFVADANSVSWDEVGQNFESNINYGIKKFNRVSNHFASSLR